MFINIMHSLSDAAYHPIHFLDIEATDREEEKEKEQLNDVGLNGRMKGEQPKSESLGNVVRI